MTQVSRVQTNLAEVSGETRITRWSTVCLKVGERKQLNQLRSYWNRVKHQRNEACRDEQPQIPLKCSSAGCSEASPARPQAEVDCADGRLLAQEGQNIEQCLFVACHHPKDSLANRGHVCFQRCCLLLCVEYVFLQCFEHWKRRATSISRLLIPWQLFANPQ